MCITRPVLGRVQEATEKNALDCEECMDRCNTQCNPCARFVLKISYYLSSSRTYVITMHSLALYVTTSCPVSRPTTSDYLDSKHKMINYVGMVCDSRDCSKAEHYIDARML